MDVVDQDEERDLDQENGLGNPVLDHDGRLVIPKEIRDAAGLEAGDSFEIELVDGGILLRPQITDEDPAVFWGPNWRAELEETEANIAAGRTHVHQSTEEFLTALDAYANANPRGR